MNPEQAPVAIAFPARWTRPLGKWTKEQTIVEIENLSRVLVEGCAAVAGVYMRLCDTIRECDLQDWVIRRELAKHFPQPRVSEIMRVSRAPDEVYLKYTAGFFGFKAALKQCRYLHITPTQHLIRRRAQRAAERIINLMGEKPGEIVLHSGWKLTLSIDLDAKPAIDIKTPPPPLNSEGQWEPQPQTALQVKIRESLKRHPQKPTVVIRKDGRKQTAPGVYARYRIVAKECGCSVGAVQTVEQVERSCEIGQRLVPLRR